MATFEVVKWLDYWGVLSWGEANCSTERHCPSIEAIGLARPLNWRRRIGSVKEAIGQDWANLSTFGHLSKLCLSHIRHKVQETMELAWAEATLDSKALHAHHAVWIACMLAAITAVMMQMFAHSQWHITLHHGKLAMHSRQAIGLLPNGHPKCNTLRLVAPIIAPTLFVAFGCANSSYNRPNREEGINGNALLTHLHWTKMNIHSQNTHTIEGSMNGNLWLWHTHNLQIACNYPFPMCMCALHYGLLLVLLIVSFWNVCAAVQFRF